MKKILFALLAFFCLSAHATNYYLSDCQAGFATGCTAGSNANNGTSTATPKQTIAALPTLVAGDTVHLARGGVWTFASVDNLNIAWRLTAGTRSSPITYTDYQGAWCSSGACLTQKPILTGTTGTNDILIGVTNNGGPIHKEGITFSNIEIKAASGSTLQYNFGVGIGNDSDYLIFDNITISGFGLGFDIGGVNGTPDLNVSDGFNDHIVLKNSNIHDNLNIGLLATGNDVLIENNNFDLNGSGAGCGNRCHNIYLGGALPQTIYGHSSRIIVRGNTLGRSGTGGTSTCSGASLNVHGNIDSLIIENNTLDATAGADGGCYGIDVVAADTDAETLSNVVVRGNKVINHGGTGIGMGSCVNCTIENNVVIMGDTGAEYAGIKLPDNTPGAGDATHQAITVRNNSIYFTQGDSNSTGIQLDTYGTLHTVVSNLIVFAAASTTGHVCFRHLPLSAYVAFDYNLCYDASAFYVWSPTYSTLAAAQAAGFDTHGKSTDPVLVATPASGNAYSMSIQTTSPAKDAGHPSLSSRLAYKGQRPVGTRDIGAYDFSATLGVPSSPSWVNVQ